MRSRKRARDQRSVLAIPSIGAPESLTRLRRKGLRAATRRRRALAADLAGLQDAGAGGMAPLAARAPPLTLRRAARAVGRGMELRDDADVARRGQRKAAGARSVTVPSWPASCGRMLRRPTTSACGARRFCMCGGQPGPGALSAPLKW